MSDGESKNPGRILSVPPNPGNKLLVCFELRSAWGLNIPQFNQKQCYDASKIISQPEPGVVDTRSNQKGPDVIQNNVVKKEGSNEQDGRVS